MSAAWPVPPTISSFVITSSSLVMPLPFQATQTLTSLLALPIQVNLSAWNCAPLEPSSGSKAVPRPMVAIAVPSFEPTL